MPVFAHFFVSASILSAYNRSVERKYWWASEIQIVCLQDLCTQDVDSLSLHLNSG